MMTSAVPAASKLNDLNAGGPAAAGNHRIGIIAGGGSLPAAVADNASRSGHRPFIIGLAGSAARDIERFPHAYVHIGETGRILRLLRQGSCTRIVFVGGIRRPNLFRIKVDAGFFLHLPKLLRFFAGGDDTVMRRVARFFEERGFQVIGVQEVAPNLLAPSGAFSRARPSAEDFNDIRLGLGVTHALGLFDIGQAAVVARSCVLAVEAAEGTDAMLERCRKLNNWGLGGRRGVAVKRAKPGQDYRLDLPVIGARTVELAVEAGLAGIAVEAGAVLLADLDVLVEKADKSGLFLWGVSPGELTQT